MLSWKRERLQISDRILNAVPLLMKQYRIPEKAAVDMVRGLVVEQETRILATPRELRKTPSLSDDALAYVEGIERYAGGMFYWYLLSPRESKPESSP